MYFSSSSLSNSGHWECFLIHKLYQEIGGICWHSKLAWPKASKVKARITNSILISIILQVWQVWPLCRIWRSFWDILDMISLMRQRSIQNSIKMRSNHEFECTKMKPSSRRSKRIYGSPNLESGPRRYSTCKFSRLGKSGLTGFGNRSDRIWLLYTVVSMVWPDLVTGLTGF